MTNTKSIKQALAEEYLRCSQDPVYFMKKYCYIQHPTRGKIKFDLYDFQQELLANFNDNRYSIILKSRQMGISTLTAGYSLWSMVFKEDFNVLVIAIKQETAKNLVTKVRVMHDLLPSWLRTGTSEDNRLSLRFRNGSHIKAVSSAPDAARSEALSLLVIDEAAFISNIDDIWTSAQQTLATGGRSIMLSTPNGTGNLFHRTWVSAEQNVGEFFPIKLHWTRHPERNQEWRDRQDSLLGKKMAAQECDCDFISSGNTVVGGELLQWYQDNMCEDPLEKRGPDEEYWIWKYPDYSRSYMVVADVARGDASDFSAFHVIDVEKMEQVAEYRNQIGTKEFGNLLVNVATEYNEALLVVENANIGWAALQPAIDRRYRNLYYTYKHEGVHDAATQLSKGYDLKNRENMTPGFSTTSRTRPLLISKLDIYFREKACIVKSTRLIEELFVFIWLGHRAEAQRGYNDDLTMAFSIALYVRDHALKLHTEGMELNKLAINNMGNTQGAYNARQANLQSNPWKQNIGGKDEDLTWLI
tara:strand:- start:274 stop:1857 length:1584 start_codon:yes stop_codon:yes gene_type:complete